MKSKMKSDPQSDALRILILEDVPTDAELVIRELRNGGIEFTSKHVDTREAFLKELGDFSPDIVLSDYSMPQFTGMEALKLTKELYPSLPLIIVTGSMNEETAVECMKAGAADYIIKENLTRLCHAVIGVLEKKRFREEKERLEEALLVSEARYRTILEEIEDGYYEVDLRGSFSFLNNPMSKIRGYSREELMGMNNRDYMDADSSKRIYKIFNQVYSTGKPRKRVEYESIKKDGTRIYVESSVSLIKDSTGQAIGFRGLVRDVSERKLMEIALEKQTVDLHERVKELNCLYEISKNS